MILVTSKNAGCFGSPSYASTQLAMNYQDLDVLSGMIDHEQVHPVIDRCDINVILVLFVSININLNAHRLRVKTKMSEHDSHLLGYLLLLLASLSL